TAAVTSAPWLDAVLDPLVVVAAPAEEEGVMGEGEAVVEVVVVDTVARGRLAPVLWDTMTAAPAPPAARVAMAIPAAALVETKVRSLVGSNIVENRVEGRRKGGGSGERPREPPLATTPPRHDR